MGTTEAKKKNGRYARIVAPGYPLIQVGIIVKPYWASSPSSIWRENEHRW
jgi:hypothetical protein